MISYDMTVTKFVYITAFFCGLRGLLNSTQSLLIFIFIPSFPIWYSKLGRWILIYDWAKVMSWLKLANHMIIWIERYHSFFHLIIRSILCCAMMPCGIKLFLYSHDPLWYIFCFTRLSRSSPFILPILNVHLFINLFACTDTFLIL